MDYGFFKSAYETTWDNKYQLFHYFFEKVYSEFWTTNL